MAKISYEGMIPARARFLKMVDDYKNNCEIIDPVVLLDWTWLRVFLLKISDEDFEKYMRATVETCSH